MANTLEAPTITLDEMKQRICAMFDNTFYPECLFNSISDLDKVVEIHLEKSPKERDKFKLVVNDAYSFQVVSGAVNLSDPCYNTTTWCGVYNRPAKNGRWLVRVTYKEKRVASWSAYHEDCNNSDHSNRMLEENFGVDSGQFGIFDAAIYDDRELHGLKNPFYEKCCEKTLIARAGTIFNHGFVSSTGWGDGNYGAVSYYDADILVGFKIDFMGSDESDYE